jgi:adenine-specific DNA-methyltransferase
MTNEGEWVFDPFLGSGTSVIAALRHNRRGMGAEVVPKYVALAKERIRQELSGTLRTRPMNKAVYDPIKAGNSLTIPPWAKKQDQDQLLLLEKEARYGFR